MQMNGHGYVPIKLYLQKQAEAVLGIRVSDSCHGIYWKKQQNIFNYILKTTRKFDYRLSSRDFPGGPVVKHPPSNAGDAGPIPGQGTKIPHATGQLSPRASTIEPVRHN